MASEERSRRPPVPLEAGDRVDVAELAGGDALSQSREAAPVAEIWRRRAFCRLGEGDLDVDAVLESLRESYGGWLVVEQDVLPDPGGAAGRPALDQRANREFLAARGF